MAGQAFQNYLRGERSSEPVGADGKKIPFTMHRGEGDFQTKAMLIVGEYVYSKLDKSDPPVDFSVFVVWFSKTLKNWKAMVSTTLPDGMYYEVTYNGEKNETYLDAYKKFENVRIPD